MSILHFSQCTLLKVTCPLYLTVNAYIVKVTFYKKPEKHGHVELVTLY